MLGDYKLLLEKFKKQNYSFVSFKEFDLEKENQIILRHDIDFDCSLAQRIAEIEYDFKISSTFFFLLTNNSYNLLSEENFKIVNNIKNLGHNISLHFDSSIYSRPSEGLINEINVFEIFFKTKIETISFHRPSSSLLKLIKEKKFNLSTSYDQIYFKSIKYISDSTGEFRYGHPLDSIEFKKGKNIQLLIHPIWWIGEGINKSERLEWFKSFCNQQKKSVLANNLNFYNN